MIRQSTSDELTYFRHVLSEAEHLAARLEFATERNFVVEGVGRDRWKISPGNVIAAISESMSDDRRPF
jgi:hypothetical protein